MPIKITGGIYIQTIFEKLGLSPRFAEHLREEDYFVVALEAGKLLRIHLHPDSHPEENDVGKQGYDEKFQTLDKTFRQLNDFSKTDLSKTLTKYLNTDPTHQQKQMQLRRITSLKEILKNVAISSFKIGRTTAFNDHKSAKPHPILNDWLNALYSSSSAFPRGEAKLLDLPAVCGATLSFHNSDANSEVDRLETTLRELKKEDESKRWQCRKIIFLRKRLREKELGSLERASLFDEYTELVDKRMERKRIIANTKKALSKAKNVNSVPLSFQVDENGYLVLSPKDPRKLRLVGSSLSWDVHGLKDISPSIQIGQFVVCVDAKAPTAFLTVGTLTGIEKTASTSPIPTPPPSKKVVQPCSLRQTPKSADTVEYAGGEIAPTGDSSMTLSPFEALGLAPSLVGVLGVSDFVHFAKRWAQKLKEVIHPDKGMSASIQIYSEVVVAAEELSCRSDLEELAKAFSTCTTGQVEIKILENKCEQLEKQVDTESRVFAASLARKQISTVVAERRKAMENDFVLYLTADLFQPTPEMNPPYANSVFLRHNKATSLNISFLDGTRHELDLESRNYSVFASFEGGRYHLLGSTIPELYEAMAPKNLAQSIMCVEPILRQGSMLVAVQNNEPVLVGKIDEINYVDPKDVRTEAAKIERRRLAIPTAYGFSKVKLK